MLSTALVSSLAAGPLVSATPARAEQPATQATPHRPATSVASPGTNLLLNPGAEAGDATATGYDAVTIPGWQVALGLPTVVHYGDLGFPGPLTPGAPERGSNFFAGGAGGTASLVQDIPIRFPASPPKTVTYRVSAWLGGQGAQTDNASVTLTFRNATGAAISAAHIGPVTAKDRHDVTEFLQRVGTGVIPPGTRAVEVALVLATNSTDYDGATSMIGYNRGFADDLSFSLSAAVQKPPPLAPPVANIPHFQHVFIVVMENEDFQSIIGNTWQAPYVNSLVPQASVLANMYAEVHPSDPNYLALSGGSTFGVLGNPIEYNLKLTINAKNLGDLIESAHETWKAYEQSANGPCDLGIHGFFYLDDIPFVYYKDIRDSVARCRAHIVTLTQLIGNPSDPSRPYDLQKASTTPNLVWIAPDDCYDGESCGIPASDGFLAATLPDIFRSPAWTTQRSMLIITWDEDGYDLERPAQRIPTLILGSSNVRQAYASVTRYTHYSLLRTIEAALGLPALRKNDLYATPLNDIFYFFLPPAGAGPLRSPQLVR